jgi:hypothetical protein
MKKLLTISFISFVVLSNAQFSKTFFETFGINTEELTLNQKYGYFNGTSNENHVLGVSFKESNGKQVHWAKVSADGNTELFSAFLPNYYISPNMAMIDVFEIGQQQFIVTQDSLSENPSGIRVLKYNNYENFVGEFFYPTEFRRGYYQAYHKFGKIYIFYIEKFVGVRKLVVNPTSLALEENTLITDLTAITTSSFNLGIKSIHVLFENENSFQIISNFNHQLNRIKVINNVAQPLESFNIGLARLKGINEQRKQVVYHSVTSAKFLYFITLNIDQTLENSLKDTVNIPINSTFNLEPKYTSNGEKDYFFVIVIDSLHIFKIQHYEVEDVQTNRLIIESMSKVEIFQNKPFVIGCRDVDNTSYLSSFSLYITFGNISDLFQFKEYHYPYDMGDFNVRFGLGDKFSRPYYGSAYGDFLFSGLIFTSSFTIVGKTDDGLYYGVNDLYNYILYKPGPYTDLTSYSYDISGKFNESYYLDHEMMNRHVYAIANNIQSYIIPKAILHWPAHGNLSKGQAADIAPFIDINENGIYEPELGEYPSFPGSKCLFNITHQHADELDGLGSGIELHSYLYTFDCEDSLKETIFYRTELYNRSSRNYDSLCFGIHSDIDIGAYNDDYTGTNVGLGLIYGYNGTLTDTGVGGMPGWGDSIPTAGSMFLKGAKFPDNGQDDEIGVSEYQSVNGYGFGDGIIDNEYKGLEFAFYYSGGSSFVPDPKASQQYFNYNNGKWRFGQQLVYGGTGFPGSTGSTDIRARYTFPGETDPMHYGTYGIDPGFLWSEETNNNPPGDRRVFGSFGSVPLASGGKMVFHTAMLSGKRAVGQFQSQIDLFAKAKYAKEAFNKNLTSCGQTFDNLTQDQISSVTEIEEKTIVKLYPNPSKDKIIVETPPSLEKHQITIFDMKGRSLYQTEAGFQKTEITVNQFENGLYFVKISMGTDVRTLKFIKQ